VEVLAFPSFAKYKLGAKVAQRKDSVLVVGAGPVGLVVALKLARRGIPVTVIEAEAEIASDPRAVVYHPPTVEALDQLGVLEDMKAVGVIKQDYQWRTFDGEILAALDMSVVEERTAYPYNLHLGQHVLAQIVMKHLMQLPGVSVLWNSRVEQVVQNADHVHINLQTPDGMQTVSASWAIGADGARSAVRKSLGLTFEGITWPERFVSTNVFIDFESYGFAKASFIADPVDFAVICQVRPDGLWRVAFGEDSTLPAEALDARVNERLARIIPGPYKLDSYSPYRVHQRVANKFRVGRVLLAGDAAHANCPIGGLGLTGGILDAVALGDALISVIQGAAQDSLLDDYAKDRHEIFMNYTSPTSTENKRRLSETDPAKRQIIRERFAKLNTDRQMQEELLLATYRLKGKSFAAERT